MSNRYWESVTDLIDNDIRSNNQI